MPSPVGHALGGVIVGLLLGPAACEPRGQARDRVGTGQGQGGDSPGPVTNGLQDLGWLALAACAPDLDFLWGRHGAETHSVGAALLAGLFVLGLTRGTRARLAIAVALAWGSHVFFDWLGSDDTPPIGVMALWPFTGAYYFANAYVFEAISRRYWLPGFWTHNLMAVVREAAILAPIVAALVWLRRSRSFGVRSRKLSSRARPQQSSTFVRRVRRKCLDARGRLMIRDLTPSAPHPPLQHLDG